MKPNADLRSDRILAGKLHLLYRGTPVIAANLGVAFILAWLLRDRYPVDFLAGWLAATALVCAGRVVLQRWFLNSSQLNRCNICWAGRFAAGAFLQGLVWGVIFLALPLWGARHDYVLMTVVGTGMAAGALATMSAYLPAYILYTSAFIVPLSAVSLLGSDRYMQGTGLLLIIYLGVLLVTAWRSNTFINRTIELKVDNELLQSSLAAAEIERDLARDEKWSSLAQLSHELRTPLNAILGFSEAMQQEFFGPLGNPRYKDYAGHLLSSGRHLLAISDELLQISQGESGQLQLEESDVDLGALLRDTVAVTSAEAQNASLTLVQEIPGALPKLRGDATKLRQMVLNLLDNAIKFTAPGGRVRLRAWSSAAGSVVIAVEDNGIGMESGDIPRAMMPFGRLATPLTLNAAGAGLGLPICKRLAELHGAELSIVSSPGNGTTCTLAFPLARTLPNSTSTAAAA